MLTKNFKDISIRKIGPDLAQELSELIQNSGPDYSKYFIPFSFDLQTVEKKLADVKLDLFFGIFVNARLVGFYMLRGFDEGYDIPSYGVWISSEFAGKGLARLTIQHAISFCKINNINQLMLKVHPDNLKAIKLYEDFGFINSGLDPKNDNLIYKKLIS